MTQFGIDLSETSMLWESIVAGPVTFVRRPEPLVAEMRILWRLPLLLLTLHHSRSDRSSLRRLHVVAWATRSPRASKVLTDALDGRRRPDSIVVRHDPTLDQTLAIAVGEGLVAMLSGGRVELTEPGRSLIRQVLATPRVLEGERHIIQTLASRTTEGWVTQLTRILPDSSPSRR